MIVKAPSAQSPSLSFNEQQNHREAPLLGALRWFWRFSKFYGEYTVRSPQARQQWLAQQSGENNA